MPIAREPCRADRDGHLTEAELARRWRISPRTVQRWRGQGRAPSHLVVGRRILYRWADVEAFERRRLRGGERRMAPAPVPNVEGGP
jgi:hypothetical protein